MAREEVLRACAGLTQKQSYAGGLYAWTPFI
jgi:hypothetical protein